MQAIKTRKTKLSGDHSDTLTSMAYLTFTWKSSGQDAAAISFRYFVDSILFYCHLPKCT